MPKRLLVGGLLTALSLVARAEVNVANIDKSVLPQDDFYSYANGAWLKSAVIPPDKVAWGSFYELDDDNQKKLKAIVDGLAPGAKPGSAQQQVGDFYASGLDEDAVNAAGYAPLQGELDRIAALATKDDVQAEIAHLHSIGVGVAFGFGSEQDPKNSAMMIGSNGQGGLGLPERDYYFRDDDTTKKQREDYLVHVANMIHLTGSGPEVSKALAEQVMNLETSLATVSKKAEDLRDPIANYHKMSVADLQKLSPNFDWTAYFKAIGLAQPDFIDVSQPDFITGFDALLAKVPVSHWKAYFRWHLLHSFSPYLSQAFVDENFAFYAKELAGSKVLRPRWKRVISTIDGEIGEDLGQLYVAQYFPPAAKAAALDMVHNLQAALNDDIKTLAWMDDATKAKAIAKLAAYTIKIGYPDKWIDYSTLTIDRGSYAMNVLHAKAFNVTRDLTKIGKPWDRTEWGDTPSTVNAYYNPSANEIVFPAGILQPPFFDPKADAASNYGGIGAVIGHEMTHGFDDEGRQFDLNGNLGDWWTQESARRFGDRGDLIVKQFNGYVAVDEIHVNGKLTEGENIADLGGLKIAYAALERKLAGQTVEKIDGFTPEQRFFLSYANIWRTLERPEYVRMNTETDAHSPDKIRVNAPLSNPPEFAKAFNIPEQTNMRRRPEDQVLIW